MSRFIIAALALIVLSAPSARAASFDCAEAKTPLEKAIGDDPALSQADEALVAAEAAALTPLSDAARAKASRGTISWHRYLVQMCGLTQEDPGEKAIAASNACLEQAFAQRLQELKFAAPKIGPFQFYQLSVFVAVKNGAPAEEGKEDSAYIETLIPQIDAPKNEAESDWNEAVARFPEFSLMYDLQGFPESYDFAYRIWSAQPNMISMTLRRSFTHGPQLWNYYPSTRLLKPARMIVFGDVFKGKPEALRPIMQKLVVSALSKDGAEAPQIQAASLDDSVNPGRWTIEPEGLGVQFQQMEVNGSNNEAPKAIIPWDKLKPYLNPNSAIKLPPAKS